MPIPDYLNCTLCTKCVYAGERTGLCLSWLRSTGYYDKPLPKRKLFCIECGASIHRTNATGYCSSCSHKRAWQNPITRVRHALSAKHKYQVKRTLKKVHIVT